MSVTQLLAIKRSDQGNASLFAGNDPQSSPDHPPFISRILRRDWPWSRSQPSSRSFDPNSSTSAILAVLLHEIRNPLGTLANAAHVLASAPNTNDITLARTMRSEVRRLQKLTDTLGLMCGGPRPTRSRFALTNAISDLLVLVTHEPGFDEGRRLISHIPDVPLAVRGDADQIQQVLWNLLLNACHHGYGPVTLRITHSRRQVKIGVSNQYRPSPVAEDPAQGKRRMGLGLEISRFILQRHGSQLCVSKTDGHFECSFALRRVRNTC